MLADGSIIGFSNIIMKQKKASKPRPMIIQAISGRSAKKGAALALCIIFRDCSA
jgi:hypothetical protein